MYPLVGCLEDMSSNLLCIYELVAAGRYNSKLVLCKNGNLYCIWEYSISGGNKLLWVQHKPKTVCLL